MSRNGSGTYTLPAGNPVVSGTTITTTWANTTLTDIANSLTGSVAADGQTPMTGALNMGSNKVSAVTDPTVAQDAATKNYVDTAVTGLSATYLQKANNLSDVASTTTSRTNLGLGTIATQAASAVAVTGGAIDGTTIGTTTRADGKFTTLAANGDVSFTSTGFLLIPSGTTAQRPASPAIGEIRYNTTTNQFEGYANSAWGALGGGATGGGADQVFNLNDQTVTVDYTIAATKNASSAGPITINTGITVTVSTGAVWVIV